VPISFKLTDAGRYLCAWGNDAASEVLTEARQLLVENYFQTPSSAWVLPRPWRISGRAPPGVRSCIYKFKLLTVKNSSVDFG